ncbi:hypothetical protein TNCV_4909671 [Trichonephila clavipes]|uniref:Uncharacterized protein n=1 Tax=Trichonephila clavipes TaxID=2585209 RepID=A0A8X6V9U8_TRICX|nr:hypothetical protein TNCV_4909671 [Trichonephila clavipes]
MSGDQVNAIKTPAACMKTVSEDRVQLCGHNKNISFLNEDGVSRQGKVMRQHPKQIWFPRKGMRMWCFGGGVKNKEEQIIGNSKSLTNIVKVLLLHSKPFGIIAWIAVQRKYRTSERRIYMYGEINALTERDVYIRRWNLRDCGRIVALASFN